MASAIQQFCLRWNNHQPNFISVFTSLLSNECLVDVTLAAEGKQLQAHKVVLSACSSYFQALFTTNPCQHPIVILKDIKFSDLKTMVDFMYYGEVNVSQDQLPAILKTAETLKIKGLADMPEQLSLSKSTSQPSTDKCDSPSPISPSVLRRKRLRKSSTGSGSEQTSEDTPVSGSGSTEIPHSPLKPDPDAEGPSPSNYSGGMLRQEASTDSEPRDSSHSFEDAEYSSRQVSQEEAPESNIKWSCVEENRPGTGTQSTQPVTPHVVEPPTVSSMGSKRGRLLMRQHRIKKESEVSVVEPPQSSGEIILGVHDTTTLNVGSGVVENYGRIERQHSEPTPNLLSVPQHSYLIKQNSSPHLTTPAPSPSIQSSSSSSSNVPSTASPAVSGGSATSQPLVNPTSSELPTPAPLPKIKVEELRRVITGSQNSSTTTVSSVLDPNEAARACHCPVLRPGPALGCNYCWNTIDNHGRILRRKTKYHCPECQTNLCIVPCFQEFHEKHPTSAGSSREGPSSCNTGSQGSCPTIVKTPSV